MKKRLCLVFAALFVLLACAPALAGVPGKPREFAYAYDFDADVLGSSEIRRIEETGEALESAAGVQLIAVAVDFLDGMDPADYATDLINDWGIGDKDDDGVVILLSRGDREIFIGTGRGIDRTLTGSKCGELIDSNIKYILLAHLSKESNTPEVAYCTVKNTLEANGVYIGNDVMVDMTYRDRSTHVYNLL